MKTEDKKLTEIVECSDCKMVFSIMETYFNWNSGARRCWTCQVSYLEQQCQKQDELIKVQNELINFYAQIIENSAMFLHVHHWEESIENIEKGRELRFKIEQLKNEIQ